MLIMGQGNASHFIELAKTKMRGTRNDKGDRGNSADVKQTARSVGVNAGVDTTGAQAEGGIEMITILGENIRLIRPEKPKCHLTAGAWRGAKAAGRKTKKLTLEMKQEIARQLGFRLAVADDTVREEN